MEQKIYMAATWKAYKAEQRRLHVQFTSVAQQLTAHPSAGSLAGGGAPPPHDAEHQRGCRWTNDLDAAAARVKAPPSTAARAAHMWRGIRGGGCGGGLQASEEPCGGGAIGVCPQRTADAARCLDQLQASLGEWTDSYLLYVSLFHDCLTPKQWAQWFTGSMPFTSDVFRVLSMAATELRCLRTYGRPAICGYDGLAQQHHTTTATHIG